MAVLRDKDGNGRCPLAKHDIQFQTGDGLWHRSKFQSMHHQPHRNSFTIHIRYKFDQTDREVLVSTLEAALGSADLSGLTSTGDLHKCANFIVTAISTAVDKAIPKSKKSERSESNPISDKTLVLILFER